MSRTPGQAMDGLLQMLPGGFASPREPDTYDAAKYLPIAEEWSRIETAMEALLAEADPRAALNLLPDYERVLGPDACGRDQLVLSSNDRRALAYQRWTGAGNVCAGYFARAGAAIGVALTITEYPLTPLGAWACGTPIVAPPQQFVFRVDLPATRVTRWVCGATACGEAISARTPNLMECVIRMEAPLWTQPIFVYGV